jgi:opacity protein-like surface antigen
MKKMILFALLFATVAASAQAAHVQPLRNVLYQCRYTNPSGEASPGFSRFDWIYMDSSELKQGIEYFDTTNWGQDNRKMTFAKPVDGNSFLYGPYTTWESTIKYGRQCTNTAVLFGGHRIDFSQCSDGSSRTCTTYY